MTTNQPIVTDDQVVIESISPPRCAICEQFLTENTVARPVYAGTNPDGSGRLAHARCWNNMRAQLRLSYGVSLDELSDREWQARQAAKPPLGAGKPVSSGVDFYRIHTKLESIREHTGMIWGIGQRAGLTNWEERQSPRRIPGTFKYHLQAVESYVTKIAEMLYAAGHDYDG